MKKNTKSIIAILFWSVVVTALMTSCRVSKEEKGFGIQLWSVRDAMNENPATTLKALGEMGYGFIEAAGYSNGKFYGMEPLAFRNLVEEHGMVFLSSHAGHDLPSAENLDSVMAWWDKCIEAHAAAGVKYIVQAWMGPAGFESLEKLKAFCDYFNAVGEKCNAKGIKFGFHNHAEEFNTIDGQVVFDFMLKNTDPEKVFFQIDLYWAFVGKADPVDYFERFPGRFILWHVKDETEVGASGKIDFERIYNYAHTAGLKHSIVEVENYNFEPLESARISLDFLKNSRFAK